MDASPAAFAKKFHSGVPVTVNNEAQQFVQRLRESVDELLLKEGNSGVK